MAKLRNGDKAVVDINNKLLRYCLDPTHVDVRGKLKGGAHARHFEVLLGLTADHAQLLSDCLLTAAKTIDATLSETKQITLPDGSKMCVENYEVRFRMVGPNGREAEVISGWAIRDTDDVPTLST